MELTCKGEPLCWAWVHQARSVTFKALLLRIALSENKARALRGPKCCVPDSVAFLSSPKASTQTANARGAPRLELNRGWSRKARRIVWPEHLM